MLHSSIVFYRKCKHSSVTVSFSPITMYYQCCDYKMWFMQLYSLFYWLLYHPCLVLFINNKLPQWALPTHPHHGSSLCPSCQSYPEDTWHFLECVHPECTALFRTLHRNLTHLTQQLHLHPCILTALWLGLMTIHTDTLHPDVLQDVLPLVCQPILLQTWLRWNRVYQGRIYIDWVKAINTVHPKMAKTGKQVMMMLQKMIWQYTLDTWTLWNHHLHRHMKELNLPDYQQAATTLYKKLENLPPAAQEALYFQPLENILELLAPQLQRWVIQKHKYFNQ